MFQDPDGLVNIELNLVIAVLISNPFDYGRVGWDSIGLAGNAHELSHALFLKYGNYKEYF